MELTIFLRGRYVTIKPEDPVNTTRAITSFCCHNQLRDCLFKSQGGWYKLTLDGKLQFITRALYLISFQDLYDTLKD
jgi:hypothetical protein